MSTVYDSEDFQQLKERAAAVFGRHPRGLPHEVFAPYFQHFRFVDFDVTLTRKFWEVLSLFAKRCGDTEIAMLVIDPDPVSYFYEHFRRYGALKLASGSSVDDYYVAVRNAPQGSPADALFDVANVACWFGTTGEWGIWGDRELGVGVVGTKKATLVLPEVDGVHWLTVDEALHGLVALNFPDQRIPQSVSQELRRVYTLR